MKQGSKLKEFAQLNWLRFLRGFELLKAFDGTVFALYSPNRGVDAMDRERMLPHN
ncbi:hypothetical protein ACPOL_5913 [Acidisarcina polymorpha]|uniref:Uncharacterized protein n=1 Tax=Acidisarcina polymorpha TaxID=2211140 RepID=A0A2Z5G8K7_9BACT|nr:hypothetical protein ACPOL_5913 [Acidisarcina polymorpha]